MKLRDMLIIKGKEPSSTLNVVSIGNITYYIIEVKIKGILYNYQITKLFSLKIPLYWFGSYYEFETFFSYFAPSTSVVFVFIF